MEIRCTYTNDIDGFIFGVLLGAGENEQFLQVHVLSRKKVVQADINS